MFWEQFEDIAQHAFLVAKAPVEAGASRKRLSVKTGTAPPGGVKSEASSEAASASAVKRKLGVGEAESTPVKEPAVKRIRRLSSGRQEVKTE